MAVFAFSGLCMTGARRFCIASVGKRHVKDAVGGKTGKIGKFHLKAKGKRGRLVNVIITQKKDEENS